ncbi:hypothetical protein LP7551_04357 [Roseibium album]|nr:hypothetical protein LP7551_04357 [Roseibium album]
MPQADLYFTSDQTLDAAGLLSNIEETIRKFDDTSGLCKGRAHRAMDYHHSHILLRLSMLPKDHRDDAFANELGQKLAGLLQSAAKVPCAINVQVRFDLVHYTAVRVEKQ